MSLALLAVTKVIKTLDTVMRERLDGEHAQLLNHAFEYILPTTTTFTIQQVPKSNPKENDVWVSVSCSYRPETQQWVAVVEFRPVPMDVCVKETFATPNDDLLASKLGMLLAKSVVAAHEGQRFVDCVRTSLDVSPDELVPAPSYYAGAQVVHLRECFAIVNSGTPFGQLRLMCSFDTASDKWRPLFSLTEHAASDMVGAADVEDKCWSLLHRNHPSLDDVVEDAVQFVKWARSGTPRSALVAGQLARAILKQDSQLAPIVTVKTASGESEAVLGMSSGEGDAVISATVFSNGVVVAKCAGDCAAKHFSLTYSQVSEVVAVLLDMMKNAFASLASALDP